VSGAKYEFLFEGQVRNLTNIFPDNFSLVMEYSARGSLDLYSKKVISQSGWDTHELYRILIGIARGMAHLAAAGIVHRDLAARNILLGTTSEPKVSDFGMSRVLNSAGETAQTNSNVGPVRWMSPENIGDRTFSEKSDVWSFGALIFELITGHEPHKGVDLIEVAVSIRDEGRNPIDQIPDTCIVPRYISKLMKRCFQVAAQDRPSFKEIVHLLEAKRPADYESAAEEDDEGPLFGGPSQKKRKKSSKNSLATAEAHETELNEIEGNYGTEAHYVPITDGTTPKGSKESKGSGASLNDSASE
jgi:serine/threonine protein kinase